MSATTTRSLPTRPSRKVEEVAELAIDAQQRVGDLRALRTVAVAGEVEARKTDREVVEVIAASELVTLDQAAREGEHQLVEQRRVADLLVEAGVGPDRGAAEDDRVVPREESFVEHLDAERVGRLDHRRKRLVGLREPAIGAPLVVPGLDPVRELGLVVGAGLESAVLVVVPVGAVGMMARHGDRGAVLAAHRVDAGAGVGSALEPVGESGAEHVLRRAALVLGVVEAVDLLRLVRSNQ